MALTPTDTSSTDPTLKKPVMPVASPTGDAPPLTPPATGATTPTAQTGPILPVAGSPTPTTPPPLATADPMAFAPPPGAASGTTSAAPTGAATLSNSPNSITQTGNYQTALTDAQSNLTANHAAGGVTTDNLAAAGTNPGAYFTAGMGSDQDYINTQLAASGFDPNGNPITPSGLNPDGTSNTNSPQNIALGGGPQAPGPAQPASGANPAASVLPPAVASGPSGIAPPTGPAADTNPATQPGPATTGTSVLPPAVASGPGYGATPTDPNNPLTAQTLSIDPTADRFKIANDQLQSTIKNVLDPAMQARQRDASRYMFGAGRGVSGQARTAQGNIQSDYGNQIAQLTATGQNNAMAGTIQDAKDREAVAAQQQGFQAGQQGTAFGQAVTGQTLADQENNQAFQQALQQMLVGSSGDPASIQAWLASVFGGQSAQSAAAASHLAGATV